MKHRNSRNRVPGRCLTILVGIRLLITSAAQTSDPAVTWRWRVPFPTGNDFRGIAQAGGTFVAAGDYGTLMSSTDGIHWASSPAAEGRSLRSIHHLNGQFLATGVGGLVLVSQDGTQWSRKPTIAGYDLGEVAFGEGRYVILANHPRTGASALLRSATLETWIREDLPLTQRADHLAYGNSFFLAAGFADSVGSTTVLKSLDGVRWTQVPSAPGEYFSGLCFGNGRFVAVGAGGGIWTTDDGLQWEPQRPTGAPFLRGIGHVDGRFLAPMNDEPYILSSSDGKDWTLEDSRAQRTLVAVSGGDGRLVAVGYNGQICLSSSPGIWRSQTQYGIAGYFPSTRAESPLEGPHLWKEQLFDVAYGSGRFVAVGDQVTATSATGLEWVFSHSQALPQSLDVIADADQFVSVGLDGVIAVSSDGKEWDTRHQDPTTIISSVCRSGDTYYILSHDRQNRGSTILRGTDLTHWKPVFSSPSLVLIDLISGNGQLVATGPGHAILLVSENGVDWREVATAGLPVSGLSFDREYGFRGVNAHSSSGTEWEFFPTTGAEFLEDHAGAGFLRAAIDSRGLGYSPSGSGDLSLRSYGRARIYTSGHLQGWTPSLSVNPPLHGIAFGADSFLAVGMGAILQSDPLSRTVAPRIDVSLTEPGSLKLTVESVPGTRLSVETGTTPEDWGPLHSAVSETGILQWFEPLEPQLVGGFFRARSDP